MTTGYVRVNGLNMYHEIHGEGDPLVLLHGSFMTIDLNYGQILPELARGRRVIAIEQQAHGHTEDIDRPLTYEQMAADTAELLQQLEVGPADILGYSVGGTIAIELAITHPELVRKLVVISAPYARAGWYPEVYEAVSQITPEMFDASPLPAAYRAVAPNPDNWPTLVEKVKGQEATFVGRTSEEFRSTQAPMLIMAGDSDGVPLEKVVEMFKLRGGGVLGDVAGLPDSQLAIIPGSSHVGIMQKPHLLLPMINEFLTGPTAG